jgi:hypothetical protein
MFTLRIIADVMFGMYLFSLLSGFANGFAERFDDPHRVRVRLDYALGFILLVAVALVSEL